ncbi:DUF1593 domain-containing protein [Enterococcus sp. HY326]|uniref:DUF1593 domain-containing protein n=1 Tax=Enterococcus sp. HY326 TaxID=2971265 RepID=UPI00223F2716|nr:DUF1593 domain-containing protein [Enterococcus sp. HY326]
MLEKKRTVITTDGEVDDMNSFLRYLLYSNEIDTAGIVLTSSVYHYAGDEEKGIEPYRWTGESWVNEFIDEYAKVYPNLQVHDKSYPTPEFLHSIYHIGNISYKGEMEKETAGSRFLETLFLDDDPRTLYVQTWGGTNTTARALKSIEERFGQQADWQAIKQKIEDKLVVYIILDQDETYSDYIAKEWNIKVINDQYNFWHFAYLWKAEDDNVTTRLQADWNYDLKMNFGPLLKKYALMADGNVLEGELAEEQRGVQTYIDQNPEYQKYDFISEGDSPSFFYLFENGLRNSEDPTYGGWGGRFIKKNEDLFINEALDWNPYTKQYEAEYSLTRWFDDIQDDFKARAKWCVAETLEEAAHYPIATVKEGLDLTASAGSQVKLTAEAKDVNGSQLYYKWWYYPEASTYRDASSLKPIVEKISGMAINCHAEGTKEAYSYVNIENDFTPQSVVHIPKDAQPGETIHIILEVLNDFDLPLKSYQRVIITVK